MRGDAGGFGCFGVPPGDFEGDFDSFLYPRPENGWRERQDDSGNVGKSLDQLISTK